MSVAAPRIIVTTDPELDDLNSMLRLLLYSNEIDLAALVVSSSQVHHAGDPRRGVAPHRWPAPGEPSHIEQAISAYAEVHHNLRRHDPRYPTPRYLRSISATGNVMDVGDMSEDTAGSKLVRDVLLADAPGRVFAQAWGGMNTIGRALQSIEEEFRRTDQWEEIYQLVTSRTVITSFAEQDATFADYIRPRWPDLEFRDVATAAWGYFAWDVVPPDAQQYLQSEWITENVSRVGPMGAAYRVWGDGKQMAAGFDREDYFGIPHAVADALEAQGYTLWTPLRSAGAWISEGDSSNFALHIQNGLRGDEDPTFSSWGGRQERSLVDAHRWNSVGMTAWQPGTPMTDMGQVGQWFGAFQRDFAARLRWSVTSDPTQANHAPSIVPVSPDRTVSAGAEVELSLVVEDPDGDDVTLRSWQDHGPTCEIAPHSDGLVVRVPADAPYGSIVHIIIEARDDGTPPLSGYARFTLRVDAAAAASAISTA